MLRKKKRKQGGHVEGEGVAQNLGKRARGGALSSANAVSGPHKGPQPAMLARGGGIHIKPSHKGLLHKDLGIPAGKTISTSVLEHAKAHADPAEKKRIVFAENAKHFHHGK